MATLKKIPLPHHFKKIEIMWRRPYFLKILESYLSFYGLKFLTYLAFFLIFFGFFGVRIEVRLDGGLMTNYAFFQGLISNI